MKNKIKLKRYLIITGICSICFFGLILMLNIYEYHTYTNNFNNKLDAIVSIVKEKYPNVSNNDIMEIINNKEYSNNSIFEEYGIDVRKESIIIENKSSFYTFLLFNSIILVSFIIALIMLFLNYDRKKDKEISEITKYIEEINRRNYKLHIDEISEDELSILRNEIYKTTIMLKENADNSLKDKINLKKSLEDISHQIKTPLTSILVILDNLIDNPDMDKETREDFNRDIKREVTNINFLIQSLLKLSKFDSNTIHFIKQKRLLKDIIEASIKNVSMLCDLKNIKINVKGEKDAKLNCDFMWQVEAVTNIIKNCVEHSKVYSQIDIEYEQNNVYSAIYIKDFGDGIDKEDLSHIFERFYKGKNASQESVGIGLSLAKTIIESDNGTISVESNKNGTKFIIKYFKM